MSPESACYTITPNTLYELRLGYNRPNYFLLQEGAFGPDYVQMLGIKNLLKDPKSNGVPNVGISGFDTIGDNTEPNGQLFNIYMMIHQLTLIRGPHTIKLGSEIRKTNYNDRGRRQTPGAHSFTGAITADPQNRAKTGARRGGDLLLSSSRSQPLGKAPRFRGTSTISRSAHLCRTIGRSAPG